MATKTGVNYWIEELGLIQHPEGGYFKETYRSELSLLNDIKKEGFEGERNALTSIYFLLPFDEYSAWHRIKSDEMWYYHSGNPLNVHVILPDGTYHCYRLGLDLEKGEQPFCWVPKEAIFASENRNFTKGYSLVSCAVSPGFDFQDFELIQANELPLKLIQEFNLPDLLVKT